MGPRQKQKAGSSESESESLVTASRTYTQRAVVSPSASSPSIQDDEEAYRQRRDRNNEAVKKSREKSRQRARETAEKMTRLRQENDDLEKRSVELAGELRTLKDILLARAGGRRKRRSGDSANTVVGQPSNSVSIATPSSQAQSTIVVLADPKTVNIDHGYGSAGANVQEPPQNSYGIETVVECEELEDGIIMAPDIVSGDYYISSS